MTHMVVSFPLCTGSSYEHSPSNCPLTTHFWIGIKKIIMVQPKQPHSENLVISLGRLFFFLLIKEMYCKAFRSLVKSVFFGKDLYSERWRESCRFILKQRIRGSKKTLSNFNWKLNMDLTAVNRWNLKKNNNINSRPIEAKSYNHWLKNPDYEWSL